jgi:hypothetical protein
MFIVARQQVHNTVAISVEFECGHESLLPKLPCLGARDRTNQPLASCQSGSQGTPCSSMRERVHMVA